MRVAFLKIFFLLFPAQVDKKTNKNKNLASFKLEKIIYLLKKIKKNF